MNEIAPRQSREAARLRAVVDTAVDGVILIDAQGRILMFNPACEKLFGYRADEVRGENVKVLMPQPFHDEHDTYLENYRRTGKRRIIGIGREVTGRRKDGTTFPMDLSVGEAEEDGEPIFVGMIHDLTERNRSARALHDALERIRAVVDTAVDGVILIDDRGTIQMFNPACERLFGYAAEEVIGHNVKILMPAPFRDEHDRYLDNYRRTGEPKIIGIGREVEGRRKDGSTFPMDLSVGEAKQGDASVFVGVIHDLTERKAAERQLVQAQKMEAVGQLSGGIAYDFNNLLTVIIGNADALGDHLKARPDLKRRMDSIIAAGERGAELTQRLLAFSRRQMLDPARLDCNALVNTMREMLSRTLREDIEIAVDTDPELWEVYADGAQLEAALLNLALNAQDAMPGGGCLTFSTANMPLDEHYREIHPEVPAGDYVMISITDDGEGMPADVQARAFEPFFTTKEVGKGSGLGLSMIYGFVKQSNGHVSLYSEPGLGTTVRLYLPVDPDAQHGRTPPKSNPVQRPLPTGQGTILVVEDDAFVCSYAVSALEELGYEVIATRSGKEALERIESGTPISLLFSDIVMPGGMSGLELVERSRELRPGLRVLLTSGYALETLAARGKLFTGATVLRKPYRAADLAATIRRALDEPPPQ